MMRTTILGLVLVAACLPLAAQSGKPMEISRDKAIVEKGNKALKAYHDLPSWSGEFEVIEEFADDFDEVARGAGIDVLIKSSGQKLTSTVFVAIDRPGNYYLRNIRVGSGASDTSEVIYRLKDDVGTLHVNSPYGQSVVSQPNKQDGPIPPVALAQQSVDSLVFSRRLVEHFTYYGGTNDKGWELYVYDGDGDGKPWYGVWFDPAKNWAAVELWKGRRSGFFRLTTADWAPIPGSQPKRWLPRSAVDEIGFYPQTKPTKFVTVKLKKFSLGRNAELLDWVPPPVSD